MHCDDIGRARPVSLALVGATIMFESPLLLQDQRTMPTQLFANFYVSKQYSIYSLRHFDGNAASECIACSVMRISRFNMKMILLDDKVRQMSATENCHQMENPFLTLIFLCYFFSSRCVQFDIRQSCINHTFLNCVATEQIAFCPATFVADDMCKRQSTDSINNVFLWSRLFFPAIRTSVNCRQTSCCGRHFTLIFCHRRRLYILI